MKEKKGMKLKTKAIIILSAIFCAIIIASASVITYYGRVNIELDLEHYILFDGSGRNNVSVVFNAEPGYCIVSYHTIENVHSSLNITINITTTADYISGIDVDVYFLPWSVNIIGYDCENLTGLSYRSFEMEPLQKYHVFVKCNTDIALEPDNYFIVVDFVPSE